MPNPVDVLEAVTQELRAIRYTEPAEGDRAAYAEAWTQVSRELAYQLARHGVANVEQLVDVRAALTPIERQLVSMPNAGDLELALSHLVNRTLSASAAQVGD